MLYDFTTMGANSSISSTTFIASRHKTLLLGTVYGLAKCIIFGSLHSKQINNNVVKTFVKIRKIKIVFDRKPRPMETSE